MSQVDEKKAPSTKLRIILCLLILVLAVAGFIGLGKLKKPPRQEAPEERALQVEAIDVTTTDAVVDITGFGELYPIRQVDLVAEVAGRVVARHPELETGLVIDKGEVLISIDDRDYRATVLANRKREAILRSDLEIARRELKRIRDLFQKKQVGTEADVEAAEKAYNSTEDRLEQVQQSLTLAENNLTRCVVRAPFTGRVRARDIEAGEYVTPGKKICTLADDSTLELAATIDSRDVLHWLGFNQAAGDVGGNWFSPLEQVDVSLSWTEAPDVAITGVLDRIMSFDSVSRSVKVAIRTVGTGGDIRPGVPLVAGMFCKVRIPGRKMKEVIVLPRWAVTYDEKIYVVRNLRLVTVAVRVVRVEGEKTFVRAQLKDDDRIITTRLVNPLEGSLVEVLAQEHGDNQ